jgi:hypothetical protein
MNNIWIKTTLIDFSTFDKIVQMDHVKPDIDDSFVTFTILDAPVHESAGDVLTVFLRFFSIYVNP